MPSRSSAFDDAVAEAEIRAELTEMLAIRERPTIRGAVVALIAAVYLVAPLAPALWVAAWAIFRLGGSLVNDWLSRRIIAMGGREAVRLGWDRRLEAGLAVAGFSWGSLVWLLPPLPWDNRAFAILVLVILIRAVMINTCALSVRAMVGFELASFAAVLAYLLLDQHGDATMIAYGLLAVPVGMLYYGFSLHRQSRDTVEARLTKARLMSHLIESEERERAQRQELSRVNLQLEDLLTATRRMALHDALTGCPNRHYFLEQVQRAVAETGGRRGSLFLAIIDFDQFKRINDLHGHPVGDAVLRTGSRVMRSVLRTDDLLARFGGEEFVLLLAHTDLDAARCIVERVCESLSAKPLDGLPPGLHPTVSIGWAELCPHLGLDHALARADASLYEAKTHGRNRVCGPPSKTQPQPQPQLPPQPA